MKKKRIKLLNQSKLYLVMVLAFTSVGIIGCSSCNDGDDSVLLNRDRVPAMLFGANLSWEHLGDGAIEHAELLFDRSFRAHNEGTMVRHWIEIPDVGTINWNTTEPGDVDAAGGKYYTGYVEFSRASNGYTGIVQQIKQGITKNAVYQINFSSYGVGGTPEINIFLYDSQTNIIGSAITYAQDGIWKQHELDIIVSADEPSGLFAIFLHNAGTVLLDEIRMAEKGKEPSVKQLYKNRIQELGVRALRWPGGTLADWFSWKEAIGPRISRGELRAYDHYETVSLGLHEFLNLCEELEIEPLITINIFEEPALAADLVEYILGDESTPQGVFRAANGRKQPWNVQYFEIGNEPAESYKGSGQAENAGANYAIIAKPIIAAMKAKASALGKSIFLSGIAEINFQLADWLPVLNHPLVKLIYNWNGQVFDSVSGITHSIDIVHGHYYVYREYDTDEETRYKNLMAGGTVLSRILSEKLSSLVGSYPLWITEYHVVLESGGIIYPEYTYTLDFQSGLSVADIILSMMKSGISGAFIWNLSQYGIFGITGTSGSWTVKPAGLVFQMISVSSEEEIIPVETSFNEIYTISSGKGIIPSGHSYELISVYATKNAFTGKARIFALNRDYENAHTVQITIEGLQAGSGIIYRYENNILSANNEGAAPNVSVSSELIPVNNPLEIVLQPHSFVRIDIE